MTTRPLFVCLFVFSMFLACILHNRQHCWVLFVAALQKSCKSWMRVILHFVMWLWAGWVWWISLQCSGQRSEKKYEQSQRSYYCPTTKIINFKIVLVSRLLLKSFTANICGFVCFVIICLCLYSCFSSFSSHLLSGSAQVLFLGTMGKDKSWLSWLLTEEINHSAHRRIAF